MRKHLRRIMFVSAAAAAAITLSAGMALAATWTVSGGGTINGGLTPGTTVTFTITTDTNGTIVFTCKTSTLSGTLRNGTGLSSAEIGHITGFTLSNCTGPVGSTGMGQQKSGTVWDVNAVSFSGGVTTGTIKDDGDGSPSGQVDFTFTFNSILGTCTFEATGFSNITYTNSSGQLVVKNSSLTISNAVGGSACDGVDNGDSANFTTGNGGYTLKNTSGGHPQVTSP